MMRKQRGFALSALIGLLPYLAAVLAAGGMYLAVQGWCNSACKDARAERDEQHARVNELQAVVKAAQDRASALALLWAKEVDNVKVRYVEQQEVKRETFASIRARAGRIGSGVRVPVDGASVGVLRDAARGANSGENSAAPGGDTQAAAPVPESARDTSLTDWVEFAVDAAEAYRESENKRLACVAWADAIKQE